jgi:hypothetical protein
VHVCVGVRDWLSFGGNVFGLCGLVGGERPAAESYWKRSLCVCWTANGTVVRTEAVCELSIVRVTSILRMKVCVASVTRK